MRNIILADNQYITKAGWQHLLQNHYHTSQIREVKQKIDLIHSLNEIPDSLIILDYTLFDFSSVNELIILQTRFETTDWIIFSDELSEDFIRSLLFNSQSFSILLKSSTKEEIISALKEIISGNRYICNHVSNLLVDSSKNQNSQQRKKVLTLTEEEILKEMAIGKTTKEIAAKRFVSAHTIMTHRKNIFRKIGVNNVHEATKYAMRAGIVDFAEYYI
jgi:DNA-binding NarL/FixJ family response regulator